MLIQSLLTIRIGIFKELIENAYEPIEDYRIGKVMDEFLFHYSRNKSQEVVDYNRTWDTEIKKVEKHAGPLPERWKAHLYMNKMRVNDMQRSQIMTGALGEFTVKALSKAALQTFPHLKTSDGKKAGWAGKTDKKHRTPFRRQGGRFRKGISS